MVRDNALQGERTLFIILYLCRNEKNKDGSVIDPDMTSEVLIHGKEKDGKRASPVSKLTTKGMSVNIVYNYSDAIEELMSGRYRECFVDALLAMASFLQKMEVLSNLKTMT